MNHKDSNPSSGKKIESESMVKKAITWLLEATKRTFKGHTKSTWVWIIFFLIIFIISVVILILQYQDDTWLFDKV
ncbi:MAG: hypothetical protein ACFFDN_50610, partial [Candidatus Hodarchaeota archaeon]